MVSIAERQRYIFDRPIMYIKNETEEISDQLLARHYALYTLNPNQVKSPYFEVCEGDRTEMFVEEDLGNGLRKRIGTSKAFTQEEMACFLETAQQSYKELGTMGDFPKDKTKYETKVAENKLTQAFMGGFNKDCAIVCIDKERKDGSRVVVGGLMITVGSEDIALSRLIGNPDASIPTLSALNFEIPEELAHIANIHANQVFCATRLFSTAETKNQKAGLSASERRRILPELVVSAEQTREALEKHLKRQLLLGIGDITDSRLLDFISNGYGWELVTNNTQPTPDILSTILSHHYGYYSKREPGIMVIMAEREKLLSLTPSKENFLKGLRRTRESDASLIQ
ncbi:MAG TPA: hypothetical protein VF185_02255 [Patescibacteria group bacterium]